MNWKTILPRLYLPLLLLLCVAYAWRPIEGGFDIWAHAAVGKWIWANQQAPRESLYLWSEQHTPWIAHSWLCQLLLYGMLSSGGPLLVVVFSTIMVTCVFFLLWKTMQQGTQISFWMPLVFALAIWVAAPRFQPRQELISALFLVLTLAFLIAWSNGRFDDWLQHKDALDSALVAVPIITLFFLWINLHAMVVIGMMILVATTLADIVQARFGRDRFDAPARSRVLVLVVITAFCLAATLLNPYGLRYWESALYLSGAQAKFVEEWKPMIYRDGWMPSVASGMWSYVLVELLLLGVGFLAWLANPQKRWSHLLWLVLATTLAFSSRRMLWLSAIIYLAVLAANANYLDTPTLWRKWRKLSGGDQFEAIPDSLRHIAHIGAVICLLAWVFSASSRHIPGKGEKWIPVVRNVPEGAARYLSKKPASWRIFNDYEDSSYLQWRLNGATAGKPTLLGRHPLFIDLLSAYPDRLMIEYFDILSMQPSGLRQLQKRRINCVVLGDHYLERDKSGKFKTPLVRYLNKNPQWRRVPIQGKDSMVWVREKPYGR